METKISIQKAYFKLKSGNMDKSDFAGLANHRSVLIRHYLARNESTPLSVLKLLIWDPDMLVRDYATRNYLKKKRREKV